MDPQKKFERYFNLSLKFISFRPRSEKEVLDYLKKKKLTEETISKIMARLVDLNFIDDLEFAKFWIDQRMRGRPRALRIIKLELKQKGIREEKIDEAVNELGKSSSDDLENARRLAERKLNSYRNLPEDERRRKLIGVLQRRGYDYEVIKKALEAVEFS
jgi:regulatory protein